MQTDPSLYLMLGVQQDLLDQHQQIQSFCDRQRSKMQNDSFSLSYKKERSCNKMNSSKRKNQNQQLQDLLQTSTIIYGNLNTQKKRLFNDLSFFSKDHTHDHSIQDQYKEYQSKIQFQRSRNKQLINTLEQQKQKIIKKYLDQMLQEFKQLSEQNKKLRQLYKKQAGGGYKVNKQKFQLLNKKQESIKNMPDNYQNQNFTPKNLKSGRRSIAAGSVCTQNIMQNKSNITLGRDRQFLGIGNGNFGPTKKLEMLRQPNKPLYCQSSINIHAGQSLVPSPKRHKRRQSQLTQRKDYPNKQNNKNDFFPMFDNNSQYELDNLQSGRMSQPGKMPKKRFFQEANNTAVMDDEKIHWAKRPQKGFPNKFTNQNQQSVQSEQDYLMVHNNSMNFNQQPISTKNIFIQFLQQLLLQQKVQYCQMTQQIQQNIIEGQNNLPNNSYNNVTFIQKVQQQISNKNRKLRQLQEVVNVYKAQIQQIMGTDIKIINSLMIQLLEVKGKYLQMQEKVNGMSGLKQQIQEKQNLKQNLIKNIKQKINKKKRQANNKVIQSQNQSQGFQNIQIFPIPQSLKRLFDILNININKNSKPLQYLNQIRNLPTNKQIFQPFDSKKRATANIKIKQVIDTIRQGRKKFNQILKIYEGRISKLQQKLQKYKSSQLPKQNVSNRGTQQKKYHQYQNKKK